MKEYNAMRFFETEEEAKNFAEEVNSTSWGWMKDTKTGKITNWYVDYINEEWADAQRRLTA